MNEKKTRKKKNKQEENKEIVVAEPAQTLLEMVSSIKAGDREILNDRTGVSNSALSYDIVRRLVECIPGLPSDYRNRLTLDIMDELEPKNALEGMLCSQIAALHFQGMSYLKRSGDATMRCHQDPDLNNAVKLLRLQHETIETLMRLRRNGEQKVVVQHVQVNANQAIVASSLNQGGGASAKIDEVPHD